MTIPVRSTLNSTYVVYLPPTGAQPPTTSELSGAGASWREAHVQRPLKDLVTRFQDAGLVSIRVEPVDQIPAPPLEILRYVGLGDLEERVMQAATHAIVVTSADLNAAPRLGLWSTLALALAIAERLDGVIFDPEALRMVKTDSAIQWFTGKGTIAASQHIIVPFSIGATGLGWMTTRGLSRFGLPDLELREVPPNLDQLTILMNAVAQFLIEAALYRARETGGKATEVTVPAEISIEATLVARAHARPVVAVAARGPVSIALRLDLADGAPDVRMVRLVPPGESTSDSGAWLNATLEQLVGRTHVALSARTGSDAMTQAHQRAVAELPYARGRFISGLKPGEVLYVKHGFATSAGSREFLWLAVTQWTPDGIVGQLANHPHNIPSLRLGQAVTLNEAELFDWMIQRADDRSEGGYTSQVALEEGTRIPPAT